MNWLVARIYDRFMENIEEACLRDWRRQLVGVASGRVLEVGAGTGANLGYYSPAAEEVILSEPDRFMREKLTKRIEDLDDGRFVLSDKGVENLGVEAQSFDSVVITLVLCSVPDIHGALRSIYEVLRPGGELIFVEHVASERPGRHRIQRLVEPVWRRCAGNCHLTRRTEAAIEGAGFTLKTIDRESMRKALPFVRPSIRGVARRPL